MMGKGGKGYDYSSKGKGGKGYGYGGKGKGGMMMGKGKGYDDDYYGYRK